MSVAIKIENLSFGYPGHSTPLIQSLNLQIEKGASFGIFGPNGAGKTTLMNLMTGLTKYSSGSITMLGHEMRTSKKQVNRLFGFVPQDFSFYQELSPAENMEFFGAWAGLKSKEIRDKTNTILEVMNLHTVKNKPVQQFSGGMKRRVNLAIAVMHEPDILFLDEPTVGVDVQSRYAMIGYLKQLNESGTTLVYTSHHLKEAEDLCDHIALIDQGKIIADNKLSVLLKQHNKDGLEGLFLDLTGRAYRD